jgi:hypothetical protein
MNLPPRGPLQPQVFTAGQHCLTVRVVSDNFAAEYRFEGSRQADTLCIPPSLLVDCEGRSNAVVKVEATGTGRITAQWQDGNVPQLCSYDPPGETPAFPELPAEFVELEPRFVAAYRAALSVREQDPLRFATDHLFLRGRTGEMAATDGRQMFIERGFKFPFEDDVLVPPSGVFSCSDLKHNGPIGMAKTEDWLVLRIGPLTLFQRINKQSRFPSITNVVPLKTNVATTLELAEADAEFLGDAIKQLPTDDLDADDSITLDLNGAAALRVVSKDTEQVTELVLTNSRANGKAMRFLTNRYYLTQAVSFGFRELLVFGPNNPIVCENEHRRYIWMPLGEEGAIKPREDSIRIESPKVEKGPPAPSTPVVVKAASRVRKNRVARSLPRVDGNGEGDLTGLIEQAEALQTMLRELASQSDKLVDCLKQRASRPGKLEAAGVGS